MPDRPARAVRRPADVPRLRARRAEAAVIACAASLAWAGLASLTLLGAAVITGSVFLAACGLVSVVDGSVSAVLVWLFRADRVCGDASLDRRRREHIVTRVVATAMLAAGVCSVVQAADLPGIGTDAVRTGPSPALLTCSLVLLPLLGAVKLRLGRRLGSPVLRGAGVLGLASGLLAAASLVGLAATEQPGWRWAGPAFALVIALALLLEGARVLRPRKPEHARDPGPSERAPALSTPVG